MKRVLLTACLVATFASTGMAQRVSSHGGFAGHSAPSGHGSFGGFHTGGGAPGRLSGYGPGRVAPPSRSNLNPPRRFPRNFSGASTRNAGLRPAYHSGANHRMPYRSPHDRDRRHGYAWGAYPWWPGFVGPYIPNYPLFYPDDFDEDSGQADFDTNQPYPNYAYGQDQQQPPYQAPDNSAYYPSPYGSGTSYASPDSGGEPYSPPSQLAQQARAPYRPESSPALPEAPLTVVFKDGRPPEKVHNYLLTSTTLSVLDTHRRDIPVAQIDLDQTAKVNRDAGIDFQVPGTARP